MTILKEIIDLYFTHIEAFYFATNELYFKWKMYEEKMVIFIRLALVPIPIIAGDVHDVSLSVLLDVSLDVRVGVLLSLVVLVGWSHSGWWRSGGCGGG